MQCLASGGLILIPKCKFSTSARLPLSCSPSSYITVEDNSFMCPRNKVVQKRVNLDLGLRGLTAGGLRPSPGEESDSGAADSQLQLVFQSHVFNMPGMLLSTGFSGLLSLLQLFKVGITSSLHSQGWEPWHREPE